MDFRKLYHIIGILFLPTVHATVCPSGYSLYSGVCYSIYTQEKTWEEAQSWCKSQNASLISLHTDSMFKHLRDYTRNNNRDIWLGLNDIAEEGQFIWEDGSTYISSRWWQPGEPNNLRNEDCIHMHSYKPAGLNDNVCTSRKAFACERKGYQDILHCKKGYQICHGPTDTTCSLCEHNKVFFKLTNSDRKCERMCSYDTHYCWPGICAEDLTRGCQCAVGFKNVSTSTKTKCQLNDDNKPSIETCDMVTAGPNGEKKRAHSNVASTACQHLQHYYGNFQPTVVTADVMATFSINVTAYTYPRFIHESHFGVTDVRLIMKVKEISGSTTHTDEHYLKRDTSQSTQSSETHSTEFNYTVPSTFSLSNGERLCLTYEAKGGGYLKPENFETNSVLSPVPYTKTTEVKELCYIFDNASPEHCLLNSACIFSSLSVSERVTRSPFITVKFDGWADPLPIGAIPSAASGLESYQISVHEVLTSSVPLKRDLKNVFSRKVNSSVTSMDLNLTSERPKLFCIFLEVKDVADNVRQARRFVLYDNSSDIETDSNKEFYINSASSKTGYLWQTHHNSICMSWTDYFINRVYLDNPFLSRIEPEAHGLITGIYEQTTGALPVTGTENVHGIISYEVGWSRNYGKMSNYFTVQNFTQQSYCYNISVKDGELYTLTVKATDVTGNTKEENRTVYIDRTVPHINNIWLVKDGYRRLFVHDSTDLSKMQLYFEALDSHSGLKTIEWSFGTTDAGSEIIKGHNKVNTINETVCPDDEPLCYCPSIGHCEIASYTIPMQKLVAEQKHNGDHNRNYYFIIKVTNHAMLSNTEHLDILVDDSPPEVGVVMEGPFGGKDIDYMSSDSFNVHWHGFVDHESGIKLYRVAVARSCLTKQELSNASKPENAHAFTEVIYTINSVTFLANFTGTMVTSIVAINNAMDVSEVVCSDGITKENKAPVFRNVTLQNGRWSETVVCHKGNAWLMQASLSKTRLYQTETCASKCSNTTDEHEVARLLPDENNVWKNSEVSEFICQTKNDYASEQIIYLPQDKIYLQWDLKESLSQIEDFFVGFGTDVSDNVDPSVIKYHSTKRHQFFKRQHIGVGADELFYIFIKARSKSGLETTIHIGPILIDETPPEIRKKPDVFIDEGIVFIGWDNHTFYDQEQTEAIDTIYFQLGHDSTPVTPLMEWVQNVSSSCDRFLGGCIKYPIKHLQRKDKEHGLQFYVKLFFYNNAGHYGVYKSDLFQVPSIYPPGQGRVYDVDPEDLNDAKDVDVHTKANTLCVRWEGFRHHEDMNFAFGVGTIQGSVNVFAFKNVQNTTRHCETSTLFSPGIKYYVFIRANCTGGETRTASNGIQILPKNFLKTNLKVSYGNDCSSTKPLKEENMNMETTKLFIFPLKAGRQYRAITSENLVNLTLSEGVVEMDTKDKTLSVYKIVPYIDQPVITINCDSICNVTIKLFDCPSTTLIKSPSNISILVKYPSIDQPKINYQVIVMHGGQNNTIFFKAENSKDAQTTGNITCLNLNYDGFKPGHSYQLALQPCVNIHCIEPFIFHNFTIEKGLQEINITTAELGKSTEKNCHDVHASWIPLPSSFSISFYQWCISGDTESKQKLTNWKTIDDSTSFLEVNECLDLPAHLHKTMFFCVRVFSEAGTEWLTCSKLDVQKLGDYDQHTVYDFDANSHQWTTILQVLHSKVIGTASSILHNAELDFGTTSSKFTGAIAYGSDRNTTWYLMEKQQVPNQCTIADSCLFTETNGNGYVHIPNQVLHENSIYYICVFANATETSREYFTELQEEIKQCSNGFIIDNRPPSAGHVTVDNTNGYITDINGLTISWSNFMDNVDATQLGYPDPIQYYSYAIGSRPGGDDIRTFTVVGHSTMAVTGGFHVADGSVIFVSVKGTDHSGLSSIATSEELIVDTSQPVPGIVMIHCGSGGSHVCSSSSVSIHLSGFEDNESGIDSYNVYVGSTCGMSDVMENIYTTRYFNLDLDKAIDGNTYCLNVKARNRAGLLSRSVFKVFTLDISPPDGGQILDGLQENLSDIDYQTDITSISSHWLGFSDIQSGIAYYRVGLGLQPYDDDVEPMTNVGLRTEITWNSTFVVGERYYSMVEACNNAGLCKTITSDGLVLDNSPPFRGIIHVGSEEGHQKYIQTRSSVHVRWFGYEDPQSDIEHFDVCFGSAPNECDLLPFFDCLLQSNIIKTGLNLTENKNYFVTIRAHNKVGLFSTSTSDAFKVDSTPPNALSVPTFKNVQYIAEYGHYITWEKSTLTIAWQFEDLESQITHHVVTLKTHHDGHTPVELQKVENVKEFTLQLNQEKWLSNGDSYIAVVTACNAAGHCTSSESSELLIDSTPPHLGGFKPSLEWHNFKTNNPDIVSTVLLSWYGFHDEESNIKLYYLSVSRSYSGNELSEGVITVPANETRSSNGLSEQTVNVTLKEALYPNDLIILTIWAGNEAGLNSTVGKVSVTCLSKVGNIMNISEQGGLLELQKHSCDVHYCNKDCTCAVVGRPCVTTATNLSCVSVNESIAAGNTPVVLVYGGLLDHKQNITSSSACLTAHWQTENPDDITKIQRFEWSMGLDQQPVGEGIFNLDREIPWRDVGIQNEIIYCLNNKSLVHGENYRIYIKVWYSEILSRDFQSDTIRIDQTSPSVRRGAYVSDSDASCKKDFDFIDWMDTITGCWENIFSEGQGHITHFTFAIGTSPGGDDVQPTMNVGLDQYKAIFNTKFLHGTKYYITVTAYNNVGLHTSASSDGFVIDMDIPSSGVVFNTDKHHDTMFQSTSEQFSMSWHGFQDHFSGIKSYSVALVDNLSLKHLNETRFITTGIRNRYTFRGVNLTHGKTYHGVVKAYDAAGHVSNMSVSNEKTIDTTPPTGIYCSDIIDDINVRNFTLGGNTTISFTFSKGESYLMRGKLSTFLRRLTLVFGARQITFPVQMLHDGTFFFEHAFISESSTYEIISIHDEHPDLIAELNIGLCEGTETSDGAAIRVNQYGTNGFIINTLVKDDESSIYKVWLGVGTTAGGFQVQSLLPIHWRDSEVVHVNLHHESPLYFTVIAENHAGLNTVFHSKPTILDKTPPIVLSRPVLVATEAENTTSAELNINVTWAIEDNESTIVTCQCALGSHSGASDLKQFKAAIFLNRCSFHNVNITHGEMLYGSVYCINDVGLVLEMTSLPLVISTDKPQNDLATMNVISTNRSPMTTESLLTPLLVVQDNQTCVHMEWRGFSDVSGIDHYQFRLLHSGVVQRPWTVASLQTMASMTDLSLVSGEEYTAEVRAVNTGHHQSSAVSTDVLVLSSSPTKTGRPMRIDHTGGNLHLDWADVFTVKKNAACLYDIVVGSHSGYNDIIDRNNVDTTGMSITVEPTMLAPDLKEIFVTLTCNYITGAFSTYNMQFPVV